MTVNTRSQKLAQKSYACVEQRKKGSSAGDFGEYTGVAKKFPALVHACGLAQAIAFARAKGGVQEQGVQEQYAADLAAVLNAGGHTEVTDPASLAQHTRNDPLVTYLRLSRDALDAAVWLKRYTEAFGEEAAGA